MAFPPYVSWDHAERLPNGADLDKVYKSGFFQVTNPVGSGDDLAAGTYFVSVLKSANADGKYIQEARDVLSGRHFVRVAAAGVWAAWAEAALPTVSNTAVAAKTTSATLTAAELLGKIITGNQGGGAGASYQLPTGSDLETALLAVNPGLKNGDMLEFSVINISTVGAEDITITTNTGWTLVGSMLVIEQAAGNPAGSNGRFGARRTAANTYTLYRLA